MPANYTIFANTFRVTETDWQNIYGTVRVAEHVLVGLVVGYKSRAEAANLK